MIIQCDECKTRFRLDDSKVTGRGVRVKCTKCQNLFVVTPPETEEEPDQRAEETFEPSFAGETPPGEKEVGEGDLGGEAKEAEEGIAPPFDTEAQPPEEEKGEEPTWEDAFGEAGTSEGEEKEEGPSWEGDFGVEEGPEGEGGFDFGGGTADADEGVEGGEEKSFGEGEEPSEWGIGPMPEETSSEKGGGEGEAGEPGLAEPTAEEEFTFATEESTEPPSPGEEESGFGFTPEQEKEGVEYGETTEAEGGEIAASPVETVTEELPQPPQVEEEREGAPSEEFIVEEEEEEVRAETAEGTAARGSKTKILLLIFLIVIGAAFYFTGGVDKITGLIGSKEGAVQQKPLDIVKLKSYPLENPNLGGIFIIEGRILSLSDKPVPVKGIKGVLFNKEGRQVAAKVVSPGRVVSAKTLTSISKADLEKRFRGKTSAQIPSKGSVPFMIVFQKDIKGLDEYTVEILR
ncbi:MAG: zinc-ribbon domain-containing protein [Thermodesulfobacteriota bacterium]